MFFKKNRVTKMRFSSDAKQYFSILLIEEYRHAFSYKTLFSFQKRSQITEMLSKLNKEFASNILAKLMI